jgi:3-mercaptopyruvate sulfurtransferase SseA
MRPFYLLSVALFIAVVALTACNSNEMIGQQGSNSAPLPQQAQQGQQIQGDGAPRITAEALHEVWKKGQVLVVDTRGEAAYRQEHIPGAIVITPNEVLAKADQLPRNKMIVTYCT